MKLLAITVLSALLAAPTAIVAQSDGLIVSHPYERELQTGGYTYWAFVCGTILYTCGTPITLTAEKQCKIKNVITEIKAMTRDQCKVMKDEAAKNRGGDIYTTTTYCPNKKRVLSYAKYNSEKGKRCRKGSDCTCCGTGNGFGDPHFLQYDGTPFSYHGKCDMVLAHSASFGNGLGLRVHGRTEIVDDWSRIRNAAVQIGNDTLELSNKGVVYINGKVATDVMFNDAALAGVYNITREVKILGNIPKTELTVRLNEDEHSEKIKLSLYKNIINVHVGADEDDLQGMLGHKALDGFVGREQMLMEDHAGMGDHWQVRSDEPMIFAQVDGPQHPKQCIMPVVDSRRLRKSQQHERRAAEACAGIEDQDMYNFCLEDVKLSGDSDLAHVYHAGLN